MLAVLIGLGLLGSAFVGFAQPENSNLPPETEADNEPPRPNEPIIVECPIDESGIGEKSQQEPKTSKLSTADTSETAFEATSGENVILGSLETMPVSAANWHEVMGVEVGELRFEGSSETGFRIQSAPLGFKECGTPDLPIEPQPPFVSTNFTSSPAGCMEAETSDVGMSSTDQPFTLSAYDPWTVADFWSDKGTQI